MRLINICLLAAAMSLIVASPALALSADEGKLLDSIARFNEKAAELQEGEPGKQVEAQMKLFNDCGKKLVAKPAMKKRLRKKADKKFFAIVAFIVFINEAEVSTYRAYKSQYLEEADNLDKLSFSDPVIGAAAKAGAQRLRNNVALYTKPRSSSPGCFILKTLANQKKWNMKSYAAAYLKGMGWTPPFYQEINNKDEPLEKPLKAGYAQLKRNGASSESLGSYNTIFAVDGTIVDTG